MACKCKYRERRRPSVFVRLSLLNIVSNLTVPLASLVDIAMLGRLAAVRSMAGPALAMTLFDSLYWSLGFLRMGTAGLTAQAIGRDAVSDADHLLRQSLRWGALLGLGLLCGAPLCGAPLLSFFGATGALTDSAHAYFVGRMWGAPAVLLNLALLGSFLGRGLSTWALGLTATANLGNVALNYLLLVRLGWGPFGAGLASALSQWLALGLGLAGSWQWWRPGGGSPAASPWSPAALLRYHRDLFVRMLCLNGVLISFMRISATFGAVMLASHTLLLRALTTVAYLVDGIAYALETLAGQHHGAGRYDLLRPLLRRAFAFALGLTALIACVVAVWPAFCFGLLTHHRAVIAAAVQGRLWLVLTMFFGAMAWTLDGYYLGLTEGRRLRNAMAGAVLLYAPLAWMAWQRDSPGLLWLALLLFTAGRVLCLFSWGVWCRLPLRWAQS